MLASIEIIPNLKQTRDLRHVDINLSVRQDTRQPQRDTDYDSITRTAFIMSRLLVCIIMVEIKRFLWCHELELLVRGAVCFV